MSLFWYLIITRPRRPGLKGHPIEFLILLDPFLGPILTHLYLSKPNRPIWTHLVPFEKVWTNLDPFGPTLKYLERFGQILSLMD